MPQRPVPGKLRQLGASLAGLGAGSSAMGISDGQPIGFKFNPTQADLATDKVNYPDYDNKLNDWITQTKALGLGANEEDKANLNEAKRLAGNADRDIKQQKLDLDQQKIDIAWTKEKDIFETRKREDADKVAMADAKLAVAKRKVEIEGENVANMKLYHQAEIESRNARTEAQKTIADEHLAEFKMQNAKQMAEIAFRREQAARETNVTRTYDQNTGLPISQTSTTRPLPANILTDPKTGKKYDTTGWDAQSIFEARSRGWK
jgi:hypothetical protein